MKAHHVTNWNTSQLQFGVTLRTGDLWDESNYWTRHIDGSFIPKRLGKLPNDLRRLFADCDRCGAGYDAIFKHVEEVNQKYKYAGEILKEYVFEDVRQQYYPSRPSRKKCIFLFKETIGADQALEALGRMPLLDRLSVLEIELDDEEGRIHFADMALLDCNDNHVKGYEEIAHRYWRGDRSDSSFVEILYEGPFEILRVLELS